MRFSVIIPVYNKAPYVAKALQSVADQSYRDYELIIVDDGSIDGSVSIVENTIANSQQLMSKTTMIRQNNAGVSTARNNGVKVSSGDYICFLDADDWWEPVFLEEMTQLIAQCPNAGIYGSSYHIVRNGQNRVAPIFRGSEDLSNEIVIEELPYCQVYAKSLCMPLTSISVAIPRRVFDEFGGFRSHLKFGEDFDLWIKIALKYPVAFLNKPLSNYNQDVDVTFRGTHRLHDPKVHMLWNLDYLEKEEESNPEYKQLIDNLRTYGLLPYYLSKEYHRAAKDLLSKVDWTMQSNKWRRIYKFPVFFLKIRKRFLNLGSKMKQWMNH